MSFSTTGRFKGPGSYLPKSVVEDAENNAGRVNVPRPAPFGTPLKSKAAPRPTSARKAGTPRRVGEDGVPLFMMATRASSARKHVQREGPKERLKFQVGEGADSLMAPPVTFGKDTKGATPMRKAKHGRFSIAGSYLLASRGHGADMVGLGHEEDKKIKKGSKSVSVIIEPRTERFGKDSYLQACFEETNAVDYISAPTSFPDTTEVGGGTSAFKSKSAKDRGEWIKQSTYLADKELADCEATQHVCTGKKGDFDESRFRDGMQTSTFLDTTARFKDIVLDPGLSSLGPPTPTKVPEPKFGTVYKKNTKHGRFSEFGAMLYKHPN